MPTDLCWAPRKMQKSGTGFVQHQQIMILVASTGGPLGCVWKIKTFYIENFYLSILDQLTIFPGYCLDGTVLSLAHPWPQSTIVRFHQRNIVHRVSKDHLRYCSHPIHPLSSLCIYCHVGLSECHFIKSGKLMASAVSGREIWRRRLFKEYCKTKGFATRVLWDLPLQRTRITKRTKKRHKHRTDIVATIHLHVYNTSVSSMWPHCPLSSGVPTMRKVMGWRKRAKKENNYIQAKQKVDQITDCRHTDGGCRILQHLLGAHDLTCPHYSLPIHCCLFPLGIFLLETFINLIKYIVAILLLHISIEIVPHWKI